MNRDGVRRVVTGHADGKAVFVGDGQPPRVIRLEKVPGLLMTEVWESAATPVVPIADSDPTTQGSRLTPGPSETRVIVSRFPTSSELANAGPNGFDPVAAREEYLRTVPGDWNFEPGALGMHATDSIDYDVILSGELWLELDDGAEVHLTAGDIVVMNGTRHAWHNRGDVPAYMFSVLVGAQRA